MSTLPNVLIIEARFYAEIADDLLDGAKAVLERAGIKFDVVTVPGVLELPAAVLFALSPERQSGQRYDGAIVLGCAVKGETDHYEHVSREAMGGVARVALALKAPLGNGILTCPTWELAQDRADPKRGDAGGRAARACLRLIELKAKFAL